MKKTIIMFVISALLLASLALWALKGRISGNIQELLMTGGVLLLVGFAVFRGSARIRSHLRHEPSEDELSKQVMTKASSLAFYVSIYLWLFIMYTSDRVTLATQSLIGAGIMGMAVIFLVSWLFVKFRKITND
jgi:NhaP-type Na+/H+ or K+/H+ antiporter